MSGVMATEARGMNEGRWGLPLEESKGCSTSSWRPGLYVPAATNLHPLPPEEELALSISM